MEFRLELQIDISGDRILTMPATTTRDIYKSNQRTDDRTWTYYSNDRRGQPRRKL